MKKKKGSETMDEVQLEHRVTEVEQRAKSNSHRLDKVEPIVNEIHTMSNTMVQLVEEIKHTNKAVNSLDTKVDRIDSRVDVMERAPAVEAKKYKQAAITAAIGVVVGALVTGVITMIAQYI